MASWKELPEDLAPEGRRLIIRMRQLKDRSGLSLTALGRRTSYSSSSWARYLNGQSRPPARAVQELAHECQDDPHRLLAMLSLAEESWPGLPPGGPPEPESTPSQAGTPEAGGGPGGDSSLAGAADRPYSSAYLSPPAGDHHAPHPPSGPPPASDPNPYPLVRDRAPGESTPSDAERSTRWSRFRWLVLAIAGALTGAGLAVGALSLGGSLLGEEEQEEVKIAETGAFPESSGDTYECEVREADDLLWAGYSVSQDAVLQNGVVGWDVVEAQCLLEHHGMSPGEVDGWYGPDTERAAQRFQEEHSLVSDGMVGPHTWGELRQ